MAITLAMLSSVIVNYLYRKSITKSPLNTAGFFSIEIMVEPTLILTDGKPEF
jgi:hypothetical protein